MHKCGLRLEKDITHKSTQHKVSHTFLLLLSQLIYNISTFILKQSLFNSEQRRPSAHTSLPTHTTGPGLARECSSTQFSTHTHNSYRSIYPELSNQSSVHLSPSSHTHIYHFIYLNHCLGLLHLKFFYTCSAGIASHPATLIFNIENFPVSSPLPKILSTSSPFETCSLNTFPETVKISLEVHHRITMYSCDSGPVRAEFTMKLLGDQASGSLTSMSSSLSLCSTVFEVF